MMKTKILVGSTGFVGQNIASATDFDGLFHSTNITDAYGTKPDLLVYAGVRAEKFLANRDVNADWVEVSKAVENIRQIQPRQLVLISTIDVWKDPVRVYEDDVVTTEGLHPYGLNRYKLELAVRELVPDCMIVRLPALYGKGLKKNFLYDMMTLVPSMLKNEKYQELSSGSVLISKSYTPQNNGFWKCLYKSGDPTYAELKKEFENLGFTSLAFTDSRAQYQFYNLSHLWKDIQFALDHHIRLLHLATEPVKAAEIFKYVYGKEFTNQLSGPVPCYDYRTRYASGFGGRDGYIENKESVLAGILGFVKSQGGKES